MGGQGGCDAPQRGKGLLKEKLELERVKTKDGRSRVTLKPIEDQLSFDKGFFVFIRALQLLRAHNQGVVLVGLGGASGSGKTAFSAKVKDFMPGIAVISMDNYNDGSKVVDSNFDDPRLTDYDLLLSNLSDLQQGKPAEVPIYDFKSSRRAGFTTLEVPESRVVVIEGIYALSDRLRPLLDLRVSITGGVHFDLVKRVLRDISRSGQGPEEIIQQITDTVFPMYKAFIEPDLKAAQLKIHNSFNPFTGFMNATYILKAPRPTDLSQQAVVAVLGAGALTKTEAEMCDIHLLPPNEDSETCASWLRMRNRDGRYTLMFEEWVIEGDFVISPRIQFEVSVRVLGGLMALGYEIGTVMRRTSTLMTSSSGDVTVKFDDVEHLGNFVQVQGKDRDKVASVAQALQMSGNFIPRSYIEQVQLAKLTTDFQTLTDDMRKRFSVDGRSVLDTVYGSSPALSPVRGVLPGGTGSRSAGGAARGAGGRYGSSRHHLGSTAAAAAAAGAAGGAAGYPGEFGSPGHDSLLSCSAPVRGSSPIAINQHRSKASGVPGSASGSVGVGGAAAAAAAAGVGGSSHSAYGVLRGPTSAVHSPTSSVAAAAGSTLAPSSFLSSEANSSAPGSVDSGSGAAAMAALAAATAGGGGSSSGGGRAAQHCGVSALMLPLASTPPAAGSGGGGSNGGGSNGGFAGKANGLLGQQLRNSSRAGSNGSLQGMEGTAPAVPEQLTRLSATGLDAAAVLAGDPASLALLRRLQDQMEVVAEGFKRHSGMQLHLDALTHQYKHLNESMAALSTATKGLTECVQQQQQAQQGQANPCQQQESNRGPLRHWLPRQDVAGSAALMAAGVATGAAVASGVLLLLLSRNK